MNLWFNIEELTTLILLNFVFVLFIKIKPSLVNVSILIESQL